MLLINHGFTKIVMLLTLIYLGGNMSRVFKSDNTGTVIGVISIIISILVVLIPAINKIFIARKKIKNSLDSGINYRLNNKIEEAKRV